MGIPGENLITGVISEYSLNRRQGKQQDHERFMQTDDFYRRIGIDKLEKMLGFWAGYLADLETIQKDIETKKIEAKLKEQRKLLFVYGSRETIHDYAAFQKYAFQTAQEPEEDSDYVSLILFARIIADLKLDFSGIEPDIEDLIASSVNDLYSEENQKTFVKSFKQAMRILGVSKRGGSFAKQR